MEPSEPVYQPSGASPSLCHTCSFVHEVSGRFGQLYLLCRNGALLEKYPRQPIRGCEGYAPIARPPDEATPPPR